MFLLVGYGTKVGLAPFHAWLPDAHAEGPTPISAVLSGLLLNVALYALLRFKMILAANPNTINVGLVLIVLGLVSLVFAAFMLYRRRDIKRLFAYSSIEHMGIITFAFGMGGPLANFAGLLHMTMHSLTKSAIFFAVGHIAQVKGTQRIADIKGLSVSHPVLAVGLALGVIAIAGLPPFGVFTSEFMLVSSSFARQPWLAVVLVFGLLVGVRRADPAAAGRAVRRAERAVRRDQGDLCAAVSASRARADGRAVAARAGGALVPRRRRAIGMMVDERTPRKTARGTHAGAGPPAVAALRDRRGRLGRRSRRSSARAAAICLACGARRTMSISRCAWRAQPRPASSRCG